MDFKKLSYKLSNPHWSPNPPAYYVLPHPETGHRCGPGRWYANVEPENQAVWNLAWGTQPSLDAAGGLTWGTAHSFTMNIAALRAVGQLKLKVPGLGGNAEFKLVELSNLVSMVEFWPYLMQIKQRNAVPAWVRNGLRTRLEASQLL